MGEDTTNLMETIPSRYPGALRMIYQCHRMEAFHRTFLVLQKESKLRTVNLKSLLILLLKRLVTDKRCRL